MPKTHNEIYHKKKIREDIEEDMSTGNKEADVYTDEGLEELEESDEIGVAEEGFMEGEHGEGKAGKCSNCGRAIEDFSDAYEEEIDGEPLFFCSERCSNNYKKKLKEREED